MLMRKLETEQGDLQQYRERQAKAAAQKADLEVQLDENKDKLEEQSQQRQHLSSEKRELESEVSSIKKEAQELEEQISKAEAEKTSRDHTMRQLNDEIANQDEIISKLNKVNFWSYKKTDLEFVFTSSIESIMYTMLKSIFFFRRRNFFKKTITRQPKSYIKLKIK